MFTYSTNRGKDFVARLKTVVPHMGKDDMLPVLRSARFFSENGKLYVEATNRFTLTRASPAPRLRASMWLTLKFNVEPGRLEIVDAQSTRTVGDVLGTFPNLTRLLDQTENTVPSATPDILRFNVDYLSLFGPTSLGRKARILFSLGGPGKGIRVTLANDDWFTGIIMPERLENCFYVANERASA